MSPSERFREKAVDPSDDPTFSGAGIAVNETSKWLLLPLRFRCRTNDFMTALKSRNSVRTRSRTSLNILNCSTFGGSVSFLRVLNQSSIFFPKFTSPAIAYGQLPPANGFGRIQSFSILLLLGSPCRPWCPLRLSVQQLPVTCPSATSYGRDGS